MLDGAIGVGSLPRRPLPASLQERTYRIRLQRSREQEALTRLAPRRPELRQLLDFLDALGDRLELERVRELDDRAYKGRTFRSGRRDLVHE